MKNKSLLPVFLLAAFALGACNLPGGQSQASKESEQQESAPSSEQQPNTSEDTTQYGVAIANKTALLEEWYAGANRDLEITLTPAGNALQELGKKNLVVSSSNEEVVKVNGLSLAALKEGTAKITVTYHGANDEIYLTILDKKPAPQKVNATPSQVMAADDSIGKVIYHVEGYVINWGTKTEWTQYGEMTVGDTADATEGMYVYGSYVEGVTFTWDGIEKYSIAYTNRDVLTNDLTKNLHIGDKVTMDVIRADYGTTKEVKGQILAVEKGAFVEATGVKIQLGNKDAAELSLRANENKLLKAVIEPDNASEDAVWSSSDPTVATVANGFVKALKAGTTTIKAKVNATVEAELALTVTEALTIVHAGTQADPYTVDEAVAVVGGYDNQAMSEADIFVKGVVLTSSWSTKYSNYTIWMADSQDAKAFEIYAGVFAAAAGVTDAQATEFQKTDGLKGYEILVSGRAKFYDNTLELTNYKPNPSESTYVYPQMLSVAKATATLTSVSILDQLELYVDDEQVMQVNPKPFYAEIAGLTWESTDTAVATVDANGKVVAVAAGTATIKVSLNGVLQGECALTVKEAAPVALPDAGLNINYATLGLANASAYADNKNRKVTIGDIVLQLDPNGAGLMGKASAPYTASGDVGVDCMQFKKGNLTSFISKSKLVSAKTATVVFYTLGYATQGVDYLPYFLVGSSTTPILANELDASNKVAGVDTGKVNGEKKIYEYTVTYDISALANERFSFISAKSGALYAGSIVISNKANIAQPVGAFRGLAKTAAGTFIPVDMVLAADSVTLSINGAAVTVTSYEWNKEGSISIVTDGAYGTISASFADNVFTITGLTGAAASQLDLTYVPALSGNCQFIDCGALTLDQMNAMFIRRYDRNDGNGWQINNPSDGRISAVTKEDRAGLQCNGFSSGKVGLTLKADLPTPIPGTVIKSVGCWIYNPGETSFEMTLYAYKSANRGSNGVLNTFTIEPGWHFYQSGVVNGSSFTSTDSFYNFQFYYSGVSANPVFDDLCIYM